MAQSTNTTQAFENSGMGNTPAPSGKHALAIVIVLVVALWVLAKVFKRARI
jgi:hypothetical protein